MSVYKQPRINELDFLYNCKSTSCFGIALAYNGVTNPYWITCKESFIFIHGNAGYNPVDFVFNFRSQERKDKFIQIFSKFCKSKKIDYKIEQKELLLRIESDFWTSNYVHLDLLACLLKEINKDSVNLDEIKNIKELFASGGLYYFNNIKMRNLFLDVKNSIKKLNFSDLTNAQIYSKLFGFGGTNGLISYVKKHCHDN